MALFSHKDEPAKSGVATAPAPTPVQAGTGRLTITKGESISIEKPPAGTAIRATATWSSKTDYDVFALVLFRDGHTETVSQFATEQDSHFRTEVGNGAVRHLGDVGRETKGDAVEIVELRLTDDIDAVAIVAYSARSNGSGSFHRFKVGLAIDNGQGTQVSIDARHANRDDGIYTCVPGIIRNTPGGVVIEALELYSHRGSEHRPVLNRDGTITMDAGPVNAYK